MILTAAGVTRWTDVNVLYLFLIESGENSQRLVVLAMNQQSIDRVVQIAERQLIQQAAGPISAEVPSVDDQRRVLFQESLVHRSPAVERILLRLDDEPLLPLADLGLAAQDAWPEVAGACWTGSRCDVSSTNSFFSNSRFYASSV